MLRALHTAATGMLAQEMNLDNIANNLANSSTAGFRARRLQFEDLLYQNMVVPGSATTQQTTTSGLQVGTGSRPAASELLQTQGDFESTGNPLDLAIQGAGFFQLKLANGGYAYTRSGSFQLDQNGNMVTSDGYQLQPNIVVPPNATNLSVGQDGTVTVTLPNQTAPSTVGTITLAMFPNPGGLNSVGQNLFLPTQASGNALIGPAGGSEGSGSLQQGALEESNVDVVDQFIQMIEAQRSYEANSRVVKAADDMAGELNQLSQ